MESKSSMIKLSKIKKTRALLFLGIVILCVAYVFWPITYTFSIKNEVGDTIPSTIKVLDKENNTLYQEDSNKARVTIWKGEYILQVEAKGYAQQKRVIHNRFSIKPPLAVAQKIILSPKVFNLSEFVYYDPTKSIKRAPKIKVKGTNILGEYVKANLTINKSLMYGTYSTTISDEHFKGEFMFVNDQFIDNGEKTKRVTLLPNENFTILTKKEGEYILNYFTDYIALSEKGMLIDNTHSFPSQFYLYKKKRIITLGEMIFMFCQEKAYHKSKTHPLFFLPSNKQFSLHGEVNSFSECYSSALKGTIPSKINTQEVSASIHYAITGKTKSTNLQSHELNKRKRGPDIAFTFDIESGRYVPEEGDHYISPCENENYSLGLSEEEKTCRNPSYLAWVTPEEESQHIHKYSYPTRSGLLGFQEILNYSERYGIPTTQYFVKKDILAFKELSPESILHAKKLIKEGFIEVGSHTRYHTHLNQVSEVVAKKEIIESKKFLESFFNVSVVGFRAPYLSILKNGDIYAKALFNAGYLYYSQSEDGYLGRISWLPLIHKPWNTASYFAYSTPSEVKDLVQKKGYLITLDHPWNLIYEDGSSLKENKTIKEKYRANMLVALSEGAIPVHAKEMRLVYPLE